MAGRVKDSLTVAHSAPVGGTAINAGHPGSKLSKIQACKRAANDDRERMACTAPTQQAKRRAPLSNLTNQTRISGGIATAKQQVPVQKKPLTTVSNKQIEAPQATKSKDVLQSKPVTLSNPKGVESNASRTLSVPESAEVIRGVAPKKISNAVDADAISALEQETRNNLYISRAPLPSVVPIKDNERTQSFMDIDSNYNDPQLCASYAKDIYQYLRMSELKRRPSTNYMESIQQDINCTMRSILVDWLVEVAEEYKLVPDTLYLTVGYLDRFLSTKMVNRQHLQLLGVACMLVAAKYEEICAPQVEEFCYITDNTYSKDEVLGMETQVLNQLHFELTGPTAKTFLRRFIKAAQAVQQSPTLHLEFLGNCLAELTLLEYDFLKYNPSIIAASAVFIAKFTLEPTARPWNTTLQHYTGYKASELKECALAIHNLQHNTSKSTLPAIREKYRQHKFKCVSTIASPTVIPSHYFDDADE